MTEGQFVEDLTREAKLAEQELIRQALEEKERLLKEHWNQFLRAKAELENYRRRVEKEKTETLLWSQARLLKLFLPLWEDLKRGVGELAASKSLDPKIREGFALVLKNMEKIFEKEGLVRIDAQIGKPYDPHVHEVVRTQESSDSDGLICEVLQEGFALGERLLVPSRVVVTKKSDKVTKCQSDKDKEKNEYE